MHKQTSPARRRACRRPATRQAPRPVRKTLVYDAHTHAHTHTHTHAAEQPQHARTKRRQHRRCRRHHNHYATTTTITATNTSKQHRQNTISRLTPLALPTRMRHCSHAAPYQLTVPRMLFDQDPSLRRRFPPNAWAAKPPLPPKRPEIYAHVFGVADFSLPISQAQNPVMLSTRLRNKAECICFVHVYGYALAHVCKCTCLYVAVFVLHVCLSCTCICMCTYIGLVLYTCMCPPALVVLLRLPGAYDSCGI